MTKNDRAIGDDTRKNNQSAEPTSHFDFCLGLHPSKARELDVLEQLRAAWASHAGPDVEERQTRRLDKLRETLNDFADHLHYRYPNGLTTHYATGTVIACGEIPPVRLGWPSPEAHDRDALDELREIAERIDVDSAGLASVTACALSTLLGPLVALHRCAALQN